LPEIRQRSGSAAEEERSVIRRVRLLIEGRVQGVGYRWFAARVARELGIRGWVTNLPDGRVEAVAVGEAAAVDALVARLREGPQHGQVARIRLTEEPGGDDESDRFEIRA
jgi:acylphosphatase